MSVEYIDAGIPVYYRAEINNELVCTGKNKFTLLAMKHGFRNKVQLMTYRLFEPDFKPIQSFDISKEPPFVNLAFI